MVDVPTQRPRTRRPEKPQTWPPAPGSNPGSRTLVFLAFVVSLAIWTAAAAMVWLPEVAEARHYVLAAMFAVKGLACLGATRYLYVVHVLGKGRRRA